MNSRGDLAVQYLVIAIVAGVVIAVVAPGGYKFFLGAGGTNDFINTLPFSFGASKNSTKTVGTGLVGIDLTNIEGPGSPLLKYYDGSAWITLKEGSKIKFAGSVFDSSIIHAGLKEFYADTPRYGNSVFRLSDGSQIEASDGKSNLYYLTGRIVQGSYDNFFLQNNWQFSPNTYLMLSHRLNPQKSDGSIYLMDVDGAFYPLTSKGEISKLTDPQLISLFSEVSPAIVKWRDQILAKQACEKYLHIAYDGGKNNDNYFVNRIDNILYIDLNQKANGPEKYGDKCFSSVGSYYVDDSQLLIAFDNFKGFTGIYWGTPKEGCARQWYLRTDFGGYVALSSLLGQEFMKDSKLKVDKEQSLYFGEGLAVIAPLLDDLNVKNVKVYSARDTSGLSASLAEFSGSFGSLIGKGEQNELMSILKDTYRKSAKLSSEGSSSTAFVDKSNEQPIVKLETEGVSVSSASGKDKIEYPKVVVVWDPKGLQGAGWYVNSTLIQVSSKVQAGISHYPFILFPSSSYQRSFDLGLPRVLLGLGVPGWVQSSTSRNTAYLNTYPRIKVTIVSESNERDITGEISPYYSMYGRSSANAPPYSEVSENTVIDALNKDPNTNNFIMKEVPVFSYSYRSTFDNDYC
jgi:hypothetical protein